MCTRPPRVAVQTYRTLVDEATRPLGPPYNPLFEQVRIYASWSMRALRMSEATPAWLGLRARVGVRVGVRVSGKGNRVRGRV